MLWFILALLAAFSISIYYMMSKHLLKKFDLYVVPGLLFLTSSIILFTVVIINGVPHIGPLFLPLAMFNALLAIVGISFYFKSLKMTDISLVIPMVAFTPIFLIFTSFLILGEVSTTWGILGIFFIFLGSYLLNLDGKGALAPIKALYQNRGTLYMLIFAFFISITVNIDKIVVLNSGPAVAAATIQFFIGIGFLTIAYKKGSSILKPYGKKPVLFILGGLAMAVAAFMTNTAFTMQIVPYVMSIQRISIIFTVLYGFLLFREKNVKNRLFGTIIMLIGATMITVL